MRRLFFIISMLLLPYVSYSQNAASCAGDRLKVGVVLGGGGAKGAAHIGALKYITELGIPIDYVVGTSMGSIIGGLYALGYTPDQLAELISNLDWSYYMGNTVQQDLMSSAQRQQYNQFLVRIPFNMRTASKNLLADEITGPTSLLGSLPSSVLGGANLTNLFNNLSLGYQDSISFDSLPVPFACVATDIVTGNGVVLRSGSFPTAIRASMAIPGVFAPVKLGNMLLMDGGMSNNFPVDVCREMGADIIIGVEVSDDLEGDVANLQSLPQLLGQLVQITVMKKIVSNRKMCDVYIRPDMTGFNTMSFSAEAIDILVKRGYNESKRNDTQLHDIKRYFDSIGFRPASNGAVTAKQLDADSIYISELVFDGVDSIESAWLIKNCQLRQRKLVSGEVIERTIDIFKGTGAYSQITYNLYPDDYTFKHYDSYKLVVHFEHSEPHDFAFGLRYDTEESSALLFSVGLNQYRISGPKLSLLARLNYNPRIKLSASYEGLQFGAVHADFEYANNNFSVKCDGDVTSTVAQNRNRLDVYWSQLYSRDFDAGFGISTGWGSYDQFAAENNTLQSAGTKPFTGLFARWTLDSRDRVYMATRGLKTDGFVTFRLPRSPNTLRLDGRPYGAVQLSVAYSYTLGNDRFVGTPQFYTCITAGGDNLMEQHTLFGGLIQNRFSEFQLPFAGMVGVDMLFDDALVLRYDLRFNFYKRQYLTLLANAIVGSKCDIFQFSSSPSDYGIVGGVAFQYSLMSKIGPIAVDLNWNTFTHHWGAYISLGYDF